MKNNNLINVVLLATVSALTASCFGFLDPKEDATQFYIARRAEVKKVDVSQKTTINLLPIIMPSYMARNQIVTLSQDGSVNLAEFDRWAESAQSGFTRVLVDNIASASDNIEVFAYPSVGENALSLRVYVNDCIGSLGGTLELVGKWQVIGDGLSVSKDFSIKTESGKSYGSYVGAINKALGELSYDIVKNIAQKQTSKK